MAAAAGETQWCAKLTSEDVREIRARYRAGESVDRLHLDFGPRRGIGTRALRRIVQGKAWRHVGPT